MLLSLSCSHWLVNYSPSWLSITLSSSRELQDSDYLNVSSV
jgi:hypothetical protein